MSYDTWELPDWDRDDLAKRAGLDARLADMVVQHLDDDPLWSQTVRGLAQDLTAADEVTDALASVSVIVANMAVGMHGGRAEAIAAFRTDLAQLRRIAMKAVDE